MAVRDHNSNKKSHKTFLQKLLKACASLKLAVVIIISIGVLTAIGTIVEAKYDATAAQKLVYHTPWMFIIMIALVINLIAVMIDRLPWKKHHLAFVLAHIGIIILLLGSVISYKFGIDGTMRFELNGKNKFVTVPKTDIVVYSSFDGDRFTKLFEQEVDFFLNSPQKNPLEIPILDDKIIINDYMKYAIGSKKIVASDLAMSGSAVRFQLNNDRANVVEWLLQKRSQETVQFNLGPAQVFLGKNPSEVKDANAIYFEPQNIEDPLKAKLKYHIISKNKKTKSGFITTGDEVETGWMGLKLKLIKYMPKAKEDWEFKKMDAPTPITTAAIQVDFRGQKSWLQLNDLMKLFTDDAVYYVTYGNRRIDVGLELFLKEFKIGRYQGTQRAMSYESLVRLPDGTEQLISMNEPLKKDKFTFYQASFQEDEKGQPIASILSVNYDPGRFLKYLGSFVMSLGIIMLFYFKDVYFGKSKDDKK